MQFENFVGRIFLLRHVDRYKQNVNPEARELPTELGEIQAFTMGSMLRQQFQAHFMRRMASPAGRSLHTNELLYRASLPLVASYGQAGARTVQEFRDLKEDPRVDEAVQKEIHELGILGHGGEHLMLAMVTNPETYPDSRLAELLTVKANEMTVAVGGIVEQMMLDEYRGTDTLVAGLHGGQLDFLHHHFTAEIFQGQPQRRTAKIFRKGEGFMLEALDHHPDRPADKEWRVGRVTELRWPLWLETVCTEAMGSGS